MRDVAVIGVGMTQFGELWGKSIKDILIPALKLELNQHLLI